jgi:molecular chaperone DnaK (HSP70)
VLLEGGSSAAPWVKEMLIHVFNDYEKIWSADKPALDISLGATYYGAIKMGLLNHPDMIATGQMIQFELTVPHDIGLEVDYLDKKTFHPLISRGTPYLLSHKSQVFNLSGNKESEMTELTINILERMHKEDSIDKCRLIGEVTINGLPKRPLGKTKLKVTLSIEEASGIVKGEVEDLGYPGLYEPSGFKTQFSPNRLEKTILTIER